MALVAHRQRFRIVPAPAAHFAHHVNIRKKVHFDAPQAVSLAGFAASALHVEAEAARAVAALPRLRQHRKQVANRREHAGVCRGIRTRRASNRRLINLDDLVDVLRANDLLVRRGRFRGAIEFLRQRAIQNVVHQRGFSRPRHAGDHRKQPQGNRDVNLLEIVRAGPENLDHFFVLAAALFRN